MLLRLHCAALYTATWFMYTGAIASFAFRQYLDQRTIYCRFCNIYSLKKLLLSVEQRLLGNCAIILHSKEYFLFFKKSYAC